MEETLCSTVEDTDALLLLIEQYAYPDDPVYIRKDHGYYLLAQDVQQCISVFKEKIVNNLEK